MVFYVVFKSRNVSDIEVLKAFPLLIIAAIWITPIIFGALYFGLNRLYAYAALIFLLHVPGQYVYDHEPSRVIVSGACILLSGAVILIRFLNKYPKS